MDTPRVRSPRPEALVRNSPFGIAVIDFDGTYQSVNDSYCRIYGFAPGALLGQNFLRVFAQQDQARVLGLHQHFLREGGSLGGLWNVLRHDGVELQVLSESIRLEAETGERQRLVYITDVTELQRTQQALQAREALLSDLTASIPGVVFRLEQSDGQPAQITWCSERLLELLGVRADLACQDIRHVLERIHPEDRAQQDQHLSRALQDGATWEQEFRIVTPDGRLKWVSVHASARRAQNTKVWTGMLTDISGRRRTEEVLRNSEETFRTLFETVPQGIVYHDRDGRVTSANPAALRILGLGFAQLVGRTRLDPLTPALREDGTPMPEEEQPARRTLATGAPVRDVVMGIRTNRGRLAWLRVSATPLFRHGQLSEVYVSFEDITRSLELSQELRRQASTDHLTGLANRRAFMERLLQEFDRARRHPETAAALMIVDLDHFKQINDTWGHSTGDTVLQQTTQHMRTHLRRLDLVARYGGEEFAILLPHTRLADAQALAERLREDIASHTHRFGDDRIHVTVSIGLTVLSPDDADADVALGRADAALYQAKDGGRNRVMYRLPAAGAPPPG